MFGLFLVVYGMYQGIEILHPLHVVLFADIIFPIIFTVVSIIGFNLSNAFSLYFHCSCWRVTSVIRYIYNLHENWIHKVLPNSKFQCLAALLLTLAMTV